MTLSPASAKSAAAAVPTKAAICVAAAAVLSGVPGSPGAGIDGDAPAPGIGRLRRGAGVGIGSVLPAGTSMRMNGVSVTARPRAFRSRMAATTVWSDGVPP